MARRSAIGRRRPRRGGGPALTAGLRRSGRAGLQPSSFAFAIGNGTLDGAAAAVGGALRGLRPGRRRRRGGERRRDRGDPGPAAPIVLAYLSVGTIEKWRGWYRRLKPYRLKAWRDWKDEWFADASKAGFRARWSADRRERSSPRGSTGSSSTTSTWSRAAATARSAPGWRKLVARLDELVDADGRLLFAQNGAPGMLTATARRRSADRPLRRLEPRGRHLDLRLRPPPLRAQPQRRPRGRARRAGTRSARPGWSPPPPTTSSSTTRAAMPNAVDRNAWARARAATSRHRPDAEAVAASPDRRRRLQRAARLGAVQSAQTAVTTPDGATAPASPTARARQRALAIGRRRRSRPATATRSPSSRSCCAPPASRPPARWSRRATSPIPTATSAAASSPS